MTSPNLADLILSASRAREESRQSRYPFGMAGAALYAEGGKYGLTSALTLTGDEIILMDEEAMMDTIPEAMCADDAEWLANELTAVGTGA